MSPYRTAPQPWRLVIPAEISREGEEAKSADFVFLLNGYDSSAAVTERFSAIVLRALAIAEVQLREEESLQRAREALLTGGVRSESVFIGDDE